MEEDSPLTVAGAAPGLMADAISPDSLADPKGIRILHAVIEIERDQRVNRRPALPARNPDKE
jgi:hypothetical protein